MAPSARSRLSTVLEPIPGGPRYPSNRAVIFPIREPLSRLSCQAIVGKEDLVVEIPKYSINMAKEGHR
jgi:hypothetical protein